MCCVCGRDGLMVPVLDYRAVALIEAMAKALEAATSQDIRGLSSTADTGYGFNHPGSGCRIAPTSRGVTGVVDAGTRVQRETKSSFTGSCKMDVYSESSGGAGLSPYL